MTVLLKNTVSVTLTPPSFERIDIRIENGAIVATGKSLTPQRGEDVYDLRGKVVMPGMVNAHTHLYSALARGMRPPKVTPKNFLQILQQVWWKLDRALDEESIYYSALIGSIEAARYGTTALIDHHASPNLIPGSLDIIKEAMEKVGIRGVLCYETTDRGGKKQRDMGLDENARFIDGHRESTMFRGYVGAHASFTLSDESLQRCGEIAAAYDTGVHIHVAEDLCDVVDAKMKHGSRVLDRLAKHKILRNDTILAHCVHLTGGDFPRAQRANCWMVHNPRSNMNNRVGYAPVQKFGNRAALGTDGFPADMFAEANFGFFKQQDSMAKNPVNMADLLSGGQRIISNIFEERFGTLRKGAPADLVVLDYAPPTPFAASNVQGHFLFGMNSSMVESVMVNGRWIVRDRELPGIDLQLACAKAEESAKKLWQKMEKL